MLVTFDPAVEGRLAGDDRALVSRNRGRDGVESNRLIRIGVLEGGAIAGDGLNAGEGRIQLHVHLRGGAERAFRLIFQRCGAAIPEVRLAVRHVENGRRAPAQVRAHVAKTFRQAIAPGKPRVVTRRARDRTGSGQARIEEQHLPQCHFFGRHGVRTRCRRRVRTSIVGQIGGPRRVLLVARGTRGGRQRRERRAREQQQGG